MKQNQLEKSIKIYQQIKELDNEITELDKFALKIANIESNTTLKLSVNDIVICEESKKLQFDEDGSIKNNESHISDMSRYLMPSLYAMSESLRGISHKDKSNNESTMSCEISSNSTLQILSILLSDKMQKREQLIKKLERFGVVF